jgi:asparagine synthase (glutamine-hydrolysing)
MCGICGIVNYKSGQPVSQPELIRIKETLRHRGPDDDGVYLRDQVGFGFRRLSIIDLGLGHQPMSNEDGSVWIVFNGEIYNHVVLRKDLIAKGHVYRTRTDTETIIHLYEEKGVDGLKKLNGMFALAIWDEKKQRLVLARDRVGIKPLYYCVTNHGLVFGSEIKAVVESDSVNAVLNEEALEEYFTFRFVSGERTIFKNISALLPGHTLVCENGTFRIQQFWDLPAPDAELTLSEQQVISGLDELLHDSVTLRLMSDVPLGTMCSGGVDSSLTTACAAEHMTAGLNTFSVGFEETEYDESAYAELVSRRFNTEHHKLVVSGRDFAESLPRMIWFNDEPLNHPNSVQIYQISKLAREFVTVVLTGEGADELFAGYPRYLIPKIGSQASILPVTIRKIADSVLKLTPSRRLKKLGRYLPLSLEEMAVLNASFVESEQVASLLAPSLSGNSFDYRYRVLTQSPLTQKNILRALAYLEFKTYLVSILNRMDKMSMAASIEGRVPFLDHRLVEWGMQLPVKHKLKGMQTKYAVKKLAERYLPNEVVHRRKSGFGVPLGEWFRNPTALGRYFDLFKERRYAERGYIRKEVVDTLVREHLEGKHDHSELLWLTVNLELWHRIYLEKETVTL